MKLNSFINGFLNSCHILSLFSCFALADGVPRGPHVQATDSTEAGFGRLDTSHHSITIQNGNSPTGLNLSNDSEDPVTLTRLIQLTPPMVNGFPLRATGLAMYRNNSILVSYTREGDQQLGAIESLGLKNFTDPVLNSQIIFDNADINALSVHGNFLYATGATANFDQSPAFAAKFQINDGTVYTENALFTELPSFAGTDIYATSNHIYVSTGDTGGISVLSSSTLEPVAFVPLRDSRALAKAAFDVITPFADKLWILSGTPATVHALTRTGLSQATVVLAGGEIKDSKLSLLSEGNLIFASVNEGGVQVICAQDGQIVGEIPPVYVDGLEGSKTVTNSAAIKSSLLFTANGEAGVAVYGIARQPSAVSQCEQLNFTRLGDLNLGKAGVSANNIAVWQDYLFVADGSEGLNILRIEKTFKPFWETLWP